MKKTKEKASDGTDASFSRQEKSNTSDANNQEKSLINQENQDYMDLVEADPERPNNWKEIRGKFWCFVLYPESAPADWKEQLNLSGIKWAASPLHDKDVNPDGTLKKPHYHVIMMWPADTTYNNVGKFTHETLNSTYPQKLGSPVGYYRYFTHEDNPEKASYDKRDIESGNGFDIADYQKMTKEQMLEMHLMLTQTIIDNEINNYVDAVMMAASMGFDEYDVITSHTMHFSNLCKSVGYKHRERKEKLDYESNGIKRKYQRS